MTRAWIGASLGLALLLTGPSSASAHTATRFFQVAVKDVPAEGSVGRVRGTLELRNEFKDRTFQVALVLEDARYGSVKPSQRVAVRAGAGERVPFQLDLQGEGKHRVILRLEVFNERGVRLGSQPVDLYFHVTGNRYRRVSLKDLYLPERPRPEKDQPPPAIDDARDAPAGAKVVPLPGDVTGVLKTPEQPSGSGVTQPGIVTPVVPTQPLEPLQPGIAPVRPGKTRIDKSRLLKRGVEGDAEQVEAQSEELEESDGSDPDATEEPEPGARLDWRGLGRRLLTALDPVPAAHAQAPSFTVRGRFSYRGLDDQLHPGWAWLVEVWGQTPIGLWIPLASRYVPPSGEWSLTFSNLLFGGQNIQVKYRAGSYYVMPQDQGNNPYWWQDPVRQNISSNENVGHRVADTSAAGTVAGLGDVYESAHLLWNKFTTHDVPPERDNPIRLFFPNDWYDCGDGSGVPWSCASVGGDVWLIAAHADDFTIQHELAHQLNNEYWSNQRPPGAGGPHTLDDCFNTGLALREGFANAVPHWVLEGENEADPDAGGFELEEPDPADICNGDTNETWVAGVFWDLLDRHKDTRDLIHFGSAVRAFSIYLNAGVKDGIRNFRTNYRNAVSANSRRKIDDVYINNTIRLGNLGLNELGDEFGRAVASGDFNGDGLLDLAVGAPGEAPGSDPASGWVFVYLGSAQGLVPSLAFGQDGLGANEAGDRFGHALAAGDFDGDGKDDLAVGAPGEAPGSKPKSGWVFTYRGTLRGLEPWKAFGQGGLGSDELDDRFGWALAAGDLDGDGKDDLAVGAPGEAPASKPKSGWVFVYRGTSNGLTSWKAFGQEGIGSDEVDDLFGTSLAAGDFDGDGKADLAVGAPGEVPDSPPLLKPPVLESEQRRLELPGGELPGRELDLDRTRLLLRTGWVYTYRGAAAGPQPWKSFGQAGLDSDEAGDRFGAALAAGDVDGDGKADLAVGAPGEAPGSKPRSGWVYAYRGAPSGLTAWSGFGQQGFGSDEADDLFGASLAAGDFDGDGKVDLAVGAPGEAPGSKPKSGWVFAFRGGTGGFATWKAFGQEGLGSDEAGDELGACLAAGDFDGDGKADLAVGAPGEAPRSDPQSGIVFTYRGQGAGPAPWKALEQEM